LPQGRRRLPRHGLGPDAHEDDRRGLPRADDAGRRLRRCRHHRSAQHRHGPGRHQHLRLDGLPGSRQVLRDPHQGYALFGRRCHQVWSRRPTTRTASSHAPLRGRRVQARRDLRPPRVYEFPSRSGWVRHLPDHEEGSTPRSAEEVRRQGLRYVDFKMGMRSRHDADWPS
jgi:hypothetical protein